MGLDNYTICNHLEWWAQLVRRPIANRCDRRNSVCRFKSCSLRHMVRIASGYAILSRKQADGNLPSCGFDAHPLRQICSNVIMVVDSLGKRVPLLGVRGSSPLCCAKPPLAANMGRYPVAGSGPDCKSGAWQLGWFESSPTHQICYRGEIGRHGRFKICCWKQRKGSSPFDSTIPGFPGKCDTGGGQ